jgi:glycosyltransferase involved in cell wall biosynthesis
MYNLAVCIPTYQRPVMLKKLLLSIFENKIDKSLINDVDIIIIDNDISKSAEETVRSINDNYIRPGKLLYYNHPAKGLSNVRNEMLKKALLQNPDFIIFVDDDEYVTTEWLNELLKTIIRNDADAAIGPVIADLDNSVSKYVRYFFKRKEYPDNSRIHSLATGNLILNRKSFEKFNVWFDNRFNSTGSEDSFFGIQFLKRGATIHWAAKAIAYETIPEKRATLKWLIKRHFNYAVSYTYIQKIERNFFLLLKKIVFSVVYLITGILSCLVLLFPLRWKYWGILKVSESIGGFAGLFSILFQEYAKDR